LTDVDGRKLVWGIIEDLSHNPSKWAYLIKLPF
jgi:hypothetical protein